MAYSWNTKPQQGTTTSTYSWGTAERNAEISQRVSLVRNQPKTFGAKLISSINQGYDSAEVAPKSFKTAFLTPAPAEAAWKSWSGTIADTSNRFNAVVDTFKDKKSTATEKGASVGLAGVGIVNTIFAPITAGINMLTPIPGVGHAADKINQVFGAIAGGSGELGVAGLQNIPGLSTKTKSELEPLVREIAGFAGMIIAGKAGSKTYGELKTKTNTLLTKIKENTNPTIQLSVKSTAETTQIPITSRVGKIRVQNAGDVSGKIPIVYRGNIYYPPESSLPVIQFGPSARTTEKVIQIGDTKQSIPEGYSYIPIEVATKVAPEYTKTVIEQNQPTAVQPKPTTAVESAKPTSTYSWSKKEEQSNKRTPETEPFRPVGALKFKAEAEKRGMRVDDVPLVERQRNIEQWKSADDFVETSPKEALRVFRGESELPFGMQKNAIEGALEKRAIETGDMALANELIKSKLGTETARELQTRNRPLSETSPIQAAREIRDLRMEVDPKSASKMKAEKESVEKPKPPTKQEFIDFIKKTLEC